MAIEVLIRDREAMDVLVRRAWEVFFEGESRGQERGFGWFDWSIELPDARVDWFACCGLINRDRDLAGRTGLVRDLVPVDGCEEGASSWFKGAISSSLVTVRLGRQSDSPMYYVFYEFTGLRLYGY